MSLTLFSYGAHHVQARDKRVCFISHARAFLRLPEPLTYASFTREHITFHGSLVRTQQGTPRWELGCSAWIALSNLPLLTPCQLICLVG